MMTKPSRHTLSAVSSTHHLLAIAVIAAVSLLGTVTASAQSLLTWGANQFGQVGINSTTNRLSPGNVVSIPNATAIAGGYYHTLAVKPDGTVWAWGLNNDGQLGDGTTVNRLVPVRTGTLTNIVAVAGGYNHSLALRADGTVWAWGNNQYGQLGDNTNTSRTLPVRVSGLTNVVAIAASPNSHSLALRADGTVWAWGNNNKGQLGDGTTINRRVPVLVIGLTDVVAISAGYNFSVVVKADGTVWAWGENGAQGRLGNNSIVDSREPVQIPEFTGVVNVSAGDQHTLAIKSDGSVWAWGGNESGQLGTGAINPSRVPRQPAGSLTGIVAVAAGAYHSFALRDDGIVFCWGKNDKGQLGLGNTTDRLTPIQIVSLTGMNKITAGGYHSIAGKGTISGIGSGNDRCLNAVPLLDGVPALIDNTYAVTSTELPGCGDMQRDVWFTFTPQTEGYIQVVLSDNDRPGRLWLAIYRGTCENLTQLACRGDTPSGIVRIENFFVEAGVRYLIRAGNHPNTGPYKLKVTLSTYPPDVVVQSVNLDRTPPDYSPGEVVTATITVANTGVNWTYREFAVDLFQNAANPLLDTCTQTGAVRSTQPPLLGGESRTIVMTFITPDAPGEYFVRVFADPTCNVKNETDRANNQRATRYRVASPDLVVQSIVLNKSSFTPNETATATITIKNQGTTDTPSVYRVTIFADASLTTECGVAGSAIIERPILFANYTDTFTLTFTTPPNEGTYTARVFVDYDCAVPEANNNNNQRILLYPVYEVPANDSCQGAFALTPGATFSQPTYRASSLGDVAPTCSDGQKGVWFEITPNITGTHTITTSGSNYDTVLSLYTGLCDTPREIACRDDYRSSLREQIVASLTAGTRYLIQVSGYKGDTGNLNIRWTEPGPPAVRYLTVESELRAPPFPPQPSLGVFMTLSPADINGNTDGFTPFQRYYNNGTLVLFTAPAVLPTGDIFSEWRVNGQLSYTERMTMQVMNANISTLTAIYVPFSNPPNTPTNIFPANGTVEITATPILQSSDFSDPDPSGDLHRASRWIVRLGLTGPTAFSTRDDAYNLTSITIPPGHLIPGASYSWRVQYKGSDGLWSKFSSPTTFTVSATPIVTVGTVTVNSMNPNSDVEVKLLQPDITGRRSGFTPLRLTYNLGSVVAINAPTPVIDGKAFLQWNMNGAPYTELATATFEVTGNRTLTAVYSKVVPQTPSNARPNNNVTLVTTTPILYSSNFIDRDGGTHVASGWKVFHGGSGVLLFEAVNDPVNLTSITVPPSILSPGLSFTWQVRHKDGDGLWSNFSIPTRNTVTTTPVVTVHTATVTSTFSGLGTATPPQVPIALLTPDILGALSKSTSFTSVFNRGPTVRLQAPPTMTVAGVPTISVFSQWNKDGLLLSTETMATFPMTANTTLNAVYVLSAVAPKRPRNLSPANGAQIGTLTPTLVASPFDNDGYPLSHVASQWIVTRASDGLVVYRSAETSVAKTSITIPANRLNLSTLYRWSVAYKNSAGVWSQRSVDTTFTTPDVLPMNNTGTPTP